MSDEQTLLAVLAAIYLIDCVYWVPHSALSVTRWFRNPWKLRFPSSVLGNQRGVLGLANPLPPLGMGCRCVGWPIAISLEGAYSAQTGIFLPWSEIKLIERDERKLILNGRFFHKATSGYSARSIREALARISKANAGKREQIIQTIISGSCDPKEIVQRTEDFQGKTVRLRLFANILFLFLFVASPFLVWRFGIVVAIWPIVAGLYAQTILIALLFSSLHRKVYPDDSDQILKPFLTMLLAAPSAIRAQDILARPLLENFHPMAVAKTLCSETDFEKLAGRTIRDLEFPPLPMATHEQRFRQNLLETLVANLDLTRKVSDYIATPKRSETVHVSYCPRCLQQFTKQAVACHDCGGRPLSPL
jgi:hypothetical protein